MCHPKCVPKIQKLVVVPTAPTPTVTESSSSSSTASYSDEEMHDVGRKEELITQIGANDVLLGRGAGPNEHSGNVAFRMTIAKFKKTYMATTNRRRKNMIARDAVKAIKATNGRFLQRVDAFSDVFKVADDAVVLEKTKQALRHIERSKRQKSGTASPPTSSPVTSSTCSQPTVQTAQLQQLLDLIKLQQQAPKPAAAALSPSPLLASLLSKPVQQPVVREAPSSDAVLALLRANMSSRQFVAPPVQPAAPTTDNSQVARLLMAAALLVQGQR
eukprot:Nitzschia sp. Nitz4//scaffold158_size52425//24430//25248//NITZ4_006858-RA/size52425-processed-gene-0.29-mRNA-1//-1//CDS//3329537510//8758//frame0